MKAQTEVVKKIGEAVDRLISVDLSARGFISVLYEEARKANDGKPLCLTAAQRIVDATAKGQPVVIATGLPIRGWLSPAVAENDGPIGAATLARALYLGTGALPVLICEPAQTYMLEGCLRAVGLIPTTFEEYDAALKSKWAIPRDLPVAVVYGFPTDAKEAKVAAEMLFARNPSAMISIERQGLTEFGTYCYGRGEENNPALMAKIDALFEEALERKIYTVGIGDGGNELGMGNIRDAVRARLPFGDKIAPEVRVSLLVSAVVSNFGCYGLEACIAAITGNTNVLHSPEQDLEIIAECTRLGGVDGITGFVEPCVDALPAVASAAFVHMLHAIVRNGLSPAKMFRVES